MLPNEFFRDLPTRSTNDLFDALAKAHEYAPEAIQAFEDELRRRGVTPESVSEGIAASAAWHKPETERAAEPLEWPVRLVCLFVFPATVFLSLDYRKKGFTQKARQSLTWGGYGVVAYLLLAIIRGALRTR